MKSYALCRMVTFSMTLTYPLPGLSRSRHIWSRISEKRRVLDNVNRKPYLTCGMVPCLVTLTYL